VAFSTVPNPEPPPRVSEADDRWLFLEDLCVRYPRSEIWPDRQLARDKTFPRPYYLNGKRAWKLSELVEWEAGLSRVAPPRMKAAAARALEARERKRLERLTAPPTPTITPRKQRRKAVEAEEAPA
jgi:hypothetical protein